MEASNYKITRELALEAMSFDSWKDTFSFLSESGFKFFNLISDEDFHKDSFQDENKIVMIGARKCNFIIIEIAETNDFSGVDTEIKSYKDFYSKL
jgi:hypothetical protein